MSSSDRVEVSTKQDSGSKNERSGDSNVFTENELNQDLLDKQNESEQDDETSHNINSLLKAEGISICEDEDLEGKTVPIGALDKIIAEESNDSSVDMETPKKARPLSPSLADQANVSAKRIHFGNRGVVDFDASDPANSVSPLKQHIDHDISTGHSAFSEHELAILQEAEENPETSRNTSYLAQFDDDPSPPRVSRPSRVTMTSVDFTSDSLFLSPGNCPRRKTADIDELKAMLGMSTPAKKEDVNPSEVSSMLNSSSSHIDAEETVVLQDLLQLSQMDQSVHDKNNEQDKQNEQKEEQMDSNDVHQNQDNQEGLETSNMDISGSESDGSMIQSRRTTMGLGEMKAMLMQELDRYDRRSSVSQRMSMTETDVLPTQPLLDILSKNPIPEEKETSISDSESTMDLQQYATQLRQELSSQPSGTNASSRESITTDLQTVAKEVLNMEVLSQKQIEEKTDELLNRMAGPLSSAAVAEIDDTVTEDLRRLSQLLSSQPEPKPRFSPLVARSGNKQVLHSVKSTQKYEQDAPEQIRVIHSMPARPLFQEEETEEEMELEQEIEQEQVQEQIQEQIQKHEQTQEQVTEQKEQEKREDKMEEEEVPPQDMSINLDAYFLPKSSHSLLDDTTPRLESVDIESVSTKIKESTSRTPSIGSLPSPIADHSIRLEESSIGEWDEKDVKDSVEKVDDSLEDYKDMEKKESLLKAEVDDNKQQKQKQQQQPVIDDALKEKVERISNLMNVNLYQQKSVLRFSQLCKQILDREDETVELCSLFREYQDRRKQHADLEEQIKNIKQEWRETENSFNSLSKQSTPEQTVSSLDEEKRKMESLQQEFDLLEKGMGIRVMLQSDHQYSILLQRDKHPLAAIQVVFLEDKRASLKVVIHMDSSRFLRKRIEARLPVKSEMVVDVKDMREQICRCLWVISHSF